MCNIEIFGLNDAMRHLECLQFSDRQVCTNTLSAVFGMHRFNTSGNCTIMLFSFPLPWIAFCCTVQKIAMTNVQMCGQHVPDAV